MRRAATILVVLCSVAAMSAQTKPAATRADRAGDEAALSKMLSTLADSLTAGNFKAAAALWDEDGVYYSVEGQKVTGPAQIEAALGEALQGARLSVQNTSVHWVTPDVAVTQGSWQANDGGGGGNSGLVMSVVRKSAGGWKFVEVRPWVPAQ